MEVFKIGGIAKRYAGDKVWGDFLSVCSSMYLNAKNEDEILASKLNGALELATVIFAQRNLDEGLW